MESCNEFIQNEVFQHTLASTAQNKFKNALS